MVFSENIISIAKHQLLHPGPRGRWVSHVSAQWADGKAGCNDSKSYGGRHQLGVGEASSSEKENAAQWCIPIRMLWLEIQWRKWLFKWLRSPVSLLPSITRDGNTACHFLSSPRHASVDPLYDVLRLFCFHAIPQMWEVSCLVIFYLFMIEQRKGACDISSPWKVANSPVSSEQARRYSAFWVRFCVTGRFLGGGTAVIILVVC